MQTICKNLIRNLGLLSLLAHVGCMSARDHSAAVHSSDAQEMTVGIVQREIHKGMPQSEVAEALGSPNIVTKDGSDQDTWIYDKIATEASYSSDSGGLFLLLTGVNKKAGASATTQKTLTVVIRFDNAQRVTSFRYHSTKF